MKNIFKSCLNFFLFYVIPIKTFFLWFYPIVITGYRRVLTSKDIPKLRDSLASNKYENIFYKRYKKASKCCCGCLRLWFTVISIIGVEYLFAGFLESISIIANLCYPLFLQQLLQQLQPVINSSQMNALDELRAILPDNLVPPSTDRTLTKLGFRDNDYYIWIWALLLNVLQLIGKLLHSHSTHLGCCVGIKVRSCFTTLIYQKSLRLSQTARKRNPKGRIINLISYDVNNMDYFFKFFWWSLSSIFTAIFSIVFLYVMIDYASLTAVGAVIPFLPIIFLMMVCSYIITRARVRYTDKKIQKLNEVFHGISVIKLFCWEESYIEKIMDIRKKELIIRRITSFLDSTMNSIIWILPELMVVVCYVTYYILHNNLDPVVMFTAYTYFDVLLRPPLFLIPAIINIGLETMISMVRISKYLDEEEEKGSDDNFEHVEGKDASLQLYDQKSPNTIEINNGCFEWPIEGLEEGEEQFELNNLNLKIKRGQFLMVFGSIGSGKTSLISALMGEMTRVKGELKINGKLSYCSQDPWIQNQTLLDNVLFGNELDEKKFAKVVECCALKRDLEILEGGRDIELGEKGCNLSGGQRFRVSLARACYFDADVYIFDDPLAAVDGKVGKQIFKDCFEGYLKNKTRILVTHALQYAPKAQMVILMDEGKVAEIGTYDKLINANGKFAKMMKTYSVTDSGKKPAPPRPRDKPQSIKRGDRKSTQPKREKMITNRMSRMKTLGRLRSTLMEPLDLDFDKMIAVESSKGPTDAEKRMTVARPFSVIIDERPLSTIISEEEKKKMIENEEKAKGSTFFRSLFTLFDNFPCRFCFSIMIILCGYITVNIAWNLAEVWITNFASEEPKFHIRYGRDFFTHYYYNISSNSSHYYDINTTAMTGIDCLNDANIICNERFINIYWDSEFSNGTKVLTGLRDGASLTIYGLIFLATMALIFFNAIMNFNCFLSGAKNIFEKAIKRVISAPFKFFESNPVGRVLSRFSQDVFELDSTLPDSWDVTISSGIGVIGLLLTSSFSTYGLFVPILIVFGVVYYLVFQFYRRTLRELKRLNAVSRSPMVSSLDESVMGLATIKAFKVQDRFIKINQGLIDKYNQSYYMLIAAEIWLIIQTDILGVILQCGVIFICVIIAYYIPALSIPLPFLSLAITYTISSTGMFSLFVVNVTNLEANLNAIERLGFYLKDIEVEEDASTFQTMGIISEGWNVTDGKIEYKNFWMKYRENLPYVLKDINLVIHPKERVAIIGRTGSGKSSLMNALFRTSKYVKGIIEFDGQNIYKLSLRLLRNSISLIPQEAELFAGTMRYNLDPMDVYSDEQLWDALKKSNFTRIKTLEMKVEAKGENFSAGEKQLCCLARALLRNTKILVLDECTSAVDAQTDALIQKTISTSFDCTILAIAHRLQTVVDFDRIVVFDAGKLVESDTPQKLLNREKSYFRDMIMESPDAESLIRKINSAKYIVRGKVEIDEI